MATKRSISSLVLVYEAASASNDIQIKLNAERAQNNLPPEAQSQEVVQLRKLFDAPLRARERDGPVEGLL